MEQEGVWYSIGRGFWTFFEGLDWMYEHLSPNIIIMLAITICVIWWTAWQAKFNKEAQKNGTHK
jgi:hypothetical protein